MTFWMRRTQVGDGGGGAAHGRDPDPDPVPDPCHRVDDRRCAQIFFWLGVEVPPRDLATAVPNGGGGGGNRCLAAVEMASAAPK